MSKVHEKRKSARALQLLLRFCVPYVGPMASEASSRTRTRGDVDETCARRARRLKWAAWAPRGGGRYAEDLGRESESEDDGRDGNL